MTTIAQQLFGLALILGLAAVLVALMRRMMRHRRARQRLAESQRAGEVAVPVLASQGWFALWLDRAGYRSPGASAAFLTGCVVLTGTAVFAFVLYRLANLQRRMLYGLETIPGGVGDVFLPVVYFAPWLIALSLAGLPWLYVRRVRRKRVELIEQDFPVALDLMATLSESGMGFDATLSRISETELGDRPLLSEFRTFQADLLSGRTRVESLRRLGNRVHITSMSIFVSALVQAAQQGMGLADILRRQADELRSRRRERAQAFANSLPVKLMFPLVICFLPGIFVWTLGPVFIQLFKIADNFLHVRGV